MLKSFVSQVLLSVPLSCSFPKHIDWVWVYNYFSHSVLDYLLPSFRTAASVQSNITCPLDFVFFDWCSTWAKHNNVTITKACNHLKAFYHVLLNTARDTLEHSFGALSFLFFLVEKLPCVIFNKLCIMNWKWLYTALVSYFSTHIC